MSGAAGAMGAAEAPPAAPPPSSPAASKLAALQARVEGLKALRDQMQQRTPPPASHPASASALHYGVSSSTVRARGTQREWHPRRGATTPALPAT